MNSLNPDKNKLLSKDNPPEISIVVVSYNTRQITRKCLERIKTHSGNINYEVIVVDNNSQDGSKEMITAEFPWVQLISLNVNSGFAGGNNVGIKEAVGRYILLLNSDAFLDEGVLEKSIEFMNRNDRIGVMGCQLTNPDGSSQPSARMLPSLLNKFFIISGLSATFPRSRFFGRVDFSWWNHAEPRPVGWVVGAYFLIRRETLEDIGLLDERYFLYFEEIDFCRTCRKAGWDVIFNPLVRVVHLGGQSSNGSQKKLSIKGKQQINTRLTSEFRYYRKFEGRAYVLLAALIEVSWNMAIYWKNFLLPKANSFWKRGEALEMIQRIFKVLWKDRLGNGYIKGVEYESN